MYLKGVVLKDYYPEYGLREMADNDILVDESRMEDIGVFMFSNGYRANGNIKSNHDAYYKNPIFNFEIHRSLFNKNNQPIYFEYYRNVKRKLIKNIYNDYEYSFSKEDFYIYFMCHSIKHLTGSGAGIRTLLDIFLYINKNTDLNWNYIIQELIFLEIYEQSEILKSISLKLFSMNGIKELNNEEKRQLSIIVNSGTYGVTKIRVINNLNKNKKSGEKHYKLKYVYDRLFLSEDKMQEYYVFFYKHKLARPLLPFYRLFKNVLSNRKTAIKELEAVINEGKNHNEF